MNRKQRRAVRRSGSIAPPGYFARKSGVDSDLAAAIASHSAGLFVEAEQRYRHILGLAPDHAEVHGRLGAVMMAQGKTSEAIAHMQQAVALNPTSFEAYGNLAQAYMALGRMEPAVVALGRAIEIRETPEGRTLFAGWIKDIRFRGEVDSGVRRLVLRALVEGWARSRELTSACVSLIKCGDVVNNCIRRAEAVWPARLTGAELFGKVGLATLAADRLLCRLLECEPTTDIGLERFLAGVRFVMLKTARGESGNLHAGALEFYSAVTRQCFINEYIYLPEASEQDEADELRSALGEKIKTSGKIPPLWPVAVGAYGPLETVAGAERLRERSWPQCVEAVIRQQIIEPAAERRIAAIIPTLTPIDDEVSRAVRQQYEENPYPRWTEPTPRIARYHAPAAGAPPYEVLIAGCGTGLSSVEFARQAPNSRILSVDLSLASLSYAKRMAESLGIGNIEFAHADILNLSGIGRLFDFIDASGVLHHLADPWAGWRVLLSLLRSGSAMHVCLYSELGRKSVVAGRALIAQRGYRPVPRDIRRCREDIVGAPDPLLRSLTEHTDFFTTSECRDLLFHVQEHRIALPQIKAFLAANNLVFGGFMLDPGVVRKFVARYPECTALTDLDRWHEFEAAQPSTFAGMYRFQVRKSVAGPS